MIHRLASLVVVLSLTHAAAGQQAPSPEPTLDEIARSLRTLLRDSMPATLYQESTNWGKTSQVPHAIHWHGLRPKIIKTARNDGTWRKLTVASRDLDRSLIFQLKNLKHTGKDTMAFDAYMSFQAGIELEQQIWESGVQLFSDRARARLRVHLPMVWEATLRLDQGPAWIPDTVLRLRVVKADLHYDQLVVEHIAGIGGTGARLLGDALHNTVKRVQPSLERDLRAKANAAIVKAGDTREIRFGLSTLLGKK